MNENNTEIMQMTAAEANKAVAVMALTALTKDWRTEPRNEDEQECIKTSYFISCEIEEMVDASLDTINRFMINRGFTVTRDEEGVMGWKYYCDKKGNYISD